MSSGEVSSSPEKGAMSDTLQRELVFVVLQYLDEQNYKEALHRLESESGYYFNMKYFEELVMAGKWDELEKYMGGFIRVDSNGFSLKTLFEIRKQNYFEALEMRDYVRALGILNRDLKVFQTWNKDIVKELTLLLTLEDIRENDQLAKYKDAKSQRERMVVELKKLIEANPLLRDKCQFPTFMNSRLQTLINQGLNWQHNLCRTPKPNPAIKTILIDHNCNAANPDSSPFPVTSPPISSMPGVSGFLQPCRPAQVPASHGKWIGKPPPVPHPLISVVPVLPSAPRNAGSKHVLKKPRPFGKPKEVKKNLPVNVPLTTCSDRSNAPSSFPYDGLPKTVVANFHHSSNVKSMDFHPLHHTLLLAGTSDGDIALWEVGSTLQLGFRRFTIWDLAARSKTLVASLARDYSVSVNRVTWSPDGKLFGVAYSKHIVHLYTHHPPNDLREHLEIEAHFGNVSDLAFAKPRDSLSIITCGEDKTIKVWDAVTGSNQFTFEGHDAPVYSILPHQIDDIKFLFSTATDGKIKIWYYNNGGAKLNHDAPGNLCTTLAYSTDGSRLFSCGSSKDGETQLVEWNESEGAVKRRYSGLGKQSLGAVQFHTTNRLLAAGDEFAVKFWDMDNSNVLTSFIAEGGLPATPCVRFNKEGMFLAVSTSGNSIKVLGNAEGLKIVRSIENRADASRVKLAQSIVNHADASRIASVTIAEDNMIAPNTSSSAAGTSTGLPDRSIPSTAVVALNISSLTLPDVRSRNLDEIEFSIVWKLKEINDTSQLCCLRLPDSVIALRIVRLTYTNSGGGILALAYNAVHKLWKWPRKKLNLTREETANVLPQLWQPPSGIIMTNDISGANPEDAVSCFAISKNDAYVMSASGGKVSLYNMMNFKTMMTLMSPPPAATAIAFHPNDNNIIAIGMSDSSVQIYNVRTDEVKSKLRGHRKRVTGLAFAATLDTLVSSGADAQLCFWRTDGWEKQASKFLQIPSGRTIRSLAETRVQFSKDQTQLLVVHETQIALYDSTSLDCLKQWVPQEASSFITDATFSCDSESIFVSKDDGSLSVLTSKHLSLRCRINPTAYLPSNSSMSVFAVAISAHPIHPNRVAVGLSDGGVCVLDPLETDGSWGSPPPPPDENGTAPCNTNSAAATNQLKTAN